MIREDVELTLRDRQARDTGLVPAYRDYCLANVPGTIGDVFGVEVGPSLPADVVPIGSTTIENVVVVLLDGLGLHRWKRDRTDHKFLDRVSERGTVTPLTSTFPSSTAAAITTIHTAAPPAAHGVFGWDVHLPVEEAVVSVFPHEVGENADGLDATPVGAADVVAVEPIYPTLADTGVTSHVVQPADTLGTDYADATFRGARQVPYDQYGAGAAGLRRILETSVGPTYAYCYVPALDSTSHDNGTDSSAYHDALARVTRHLSRELYDDLDSTVASETLLIITADHGMTDLEPGLAGCLNLGKIDEVTENLARWSSGRVIPPVADPRGTHFWLRHGAADVVVEALEAMGVRTFTRSEVADLGLYGPSPEPTFERRCGDLVCYHPEKKLVADETETVVPKIGMHGGLTPREMLVPFATARLDELQT
ncbi:alkaline phosphatase family protein [Halobacteria archaeon HArc-gm2]|nr:alkaline phosphatase family protein [Halobacteria archaeon HArc-gm2]